MSESDCMNSVRFTCPKCRHPLQPGENTLRCSECSRTYPLTGGIPDFLSEGQLASAAPNYRWIKMLEFLAPIYEGPLWHTFILKTLAGAGHSSLHSIESFISDAMEGVTGSVLDAACGPATYGRRIVSSSRNVHGIDFSMGTLQQGLANIARDGITGVRLARARVEELPFENAVFDGAICSGSLHLFPDMVLALREIVRALQAGAPLTVQTFVAGGKPVLMRLLDRCRDVHPFRLPELEQCLTEAGFGEFRPHLVGILFRFTACKAVPQV